MKFTVISMLTLCAWSQVTLPPFQGVLGSGGITYSADYFIDFEGGSAGDVVTTSNMGLHGTGVCSWGTDGGSLMTISSTGAKVLPNAVTIGGIRYTGNPSIHSFKFDPNGTFTQQTVHCLINSGVGVPVASAGSFYRTTSTSLTPLSIGNVALTSSGAGGYAVSHWTYSGSTYGLHITGGDTCYPSDPIPINTNTDYWVAIRYSSGELARLYVWETSTWTLVGACTATLSAHNTNFFTFGRFGDDSGGSTGSGQWYFDNHLLSLSGVWPLVPAAVTVNAPTFSKGAGNYYNYVSVNISNLVPEASIVYCTDSINSCTPAASYTGPVIINTVGTTYLRALGKASGWHNSSVTSAAYSITSAPYYQSATNQMGSGTSNSVTFTNQVQSGHLIIGAVLWNSTSSTLDSVSDNCGNTYTLKNNPTTVSGGAQRRMAMFYSSPAASTGNCTVTATISSSGISDVVVHEITSSGFDVSGAVGNISGTGTDGCSSGNVTTTADGDYIFGVGYVGGTLTAGTGFTIAGSISVNPGLWSEWKTQASRGSVAATFTPNAQAYQLIGIMAFKP